MNGFMETVQVQFIYTVPTLTTSTVIFIYIFIYSFLCTPSDSHKFKIVTDVYLERRRNRMKSDGLH